MAGDTCTHTVTTKDGDVLHCGQTHDPAKCKAHKLLREDPADRASRIVGVRQCGLPPVRGATVCHMHGGKAPTVKAKGERRVAEQKAAEAVKTYGLPLDVSPTDALLDEVRWTAGHVAWLRERVQEIEQANLVWGKTKTDEHLATEFPGVNTTEAAVPNAFLDLYMKERAHLVRVCSDAIRCGIEERRVRLAEKQGALLADVIRAILSDLDLSPEQQAKVATVVPRHLRAVA